MPPSCAYPDSDGDGTVDPIDDLTGGAGDPTRGVLITDDAQVLEVSTNAGRLTGLAAVDDPAPGGHPGVDLPFGTLTFAIEGLSQGATADVTFLVVDGDAMPPGSTYWKFGPATPGATASWFDFSFDESTGLGARTLDPIDVPDLGLRRPLVVSYQDGALGDTDELANGTVVDPGAIALLPGESGGDNPSDEPAGGGRGDEPGVIGAWPEVAPSGAAASAPEPSRTSSEVLASTGAPVLALAVAGAALILMGIACGRTTLRLGPRRRGGSSDGRPRAATEGP